MTNIQQIVARALALLLALTIHEFFHAWVADRLGDPTARYMGRVSLNPLVHLDPLGTMMMLMAIFSGVGIGWGKPVPVNPRNLRYGPRLGMGIVSLAGPFANLLTAAAFGLPLRFGLQLPGNLLALFLAIVLVNIGLAVFNLIPIPPLDGYGVLQGILAGMRGSWAYRVSRSLTSLEYQGPYLLFFVILADQFLGLGLLWRILGPLSTLFTRLFLGL